MDKNCFYCVKDSRLQDLMIEICQMDASTLYLFKDQTHKGRCVLAYKEHKTEFFQLSPEELNSFAKDISRVANAIHKAFNSDKINYGVFGDTVPHLHVHIVPKKVGGKNWGKPFEMNNPDKELLSENDFNEIIKAIKACL